MESGEASPSFAPCWHCLQPEHAGHLYGTLCMLSVPLVQISMSSFLDFAVIVSGPSVVIKLMLSVLLGTKVSFCWRQVHENSSVFVDLSYLKLC